jgi:hypothetical protein
MILVLVFADPGKKDARCRPEVAPVVGGTTLLGFIFLYTGAHVLYYGPREAALAPLISGTALLAVGLLLVRSRRRIADRAASVMRIARPDRRWVEHVRADMLTLDRPVRAAIPPPGTRYESFMARLLAAASQPSAQVQPTNHLGNLSMALPRIPPKETGDQSDSAAEALE